MWMCQALQQVPRGPILEVGGSVRDKDRK